jgi:hypothetical protein
VDDVTARYQGTLSADNLARLPALIADASTVVTSFTRQQFVSATTTERIRPIGDRVRLRQAPVASVGTVAMVDTLTTGNVIAFPIGAWIWDGGQEIWIGGLRTVINIPEALTHFLEFQIPLMEVTYTHGYTQIPDAVVTVICAMVIRYIGIPASTGMPVNRVGEVEYRLSLPAQEGLLGLTDSEMRLLAPYRRPGTTVELR